MLPFPAISSAVTAVTASIFILIVRNLQEKEENNEGEQEFISNEQLSAAILSELSADIEEENSNEIDFELLEEKFKVLEAEELGKVESGEGNLVEVDESESVSFTSKAAESQADLLIEATHNLRNSGQHRPYTLSLHFMPRPRGESETPIPWRHCKLQLEWPLPRSVFVDVWALRRLTPFTVDYYSSHVLNPSSVVAGMPSWSVKPRHPDLEVGAYDAKARPFVLTAQVPFRIDKDSSTPRVENGKLVHVDAPWNLDLHVPDLVMRYQAAARGGLFEKHASRITYIPAPNLHLKCVRVEDELHSGLDNLQIEWQLNRLRPLQLSLPIGSATPIVSHVTAASVIFSSLFLLVILLKF